MNPGGKRAWQWAHRAAAEDAHEVPERREGLALRQGAAFLAGSFSAVSKRNFAGKYAFCSIFQNLPDYQAEIFEIWQIL